MVNVKLGTLNNVANAMSKCTLPSQAFHVSTHNSRELGCISLRFKGLPEEYRWGFPHIRNSKKCSSQFYQQMACCRLPSAGKHFILEVVGPVKR